MFMLADLRHDSCPSDFSVSTNKALPPPSPNMDLDPDIVVPSIETNDQEKNTSLTPQRAGVNLNETLRNVPSSVSRTGTRQSTSRLEPSPSRTPFKTPRGRSSTPSSTSISRSPSVASLRNDRSSTPKLDKKRSTPNLTVRSSTPAHQPQFRRASSNLNPSTPLRMKSLERPQMTPASVAKDYFQKELTSHSRSTSKVVVFTHDACYGHRFSRPRSTKATLASIVERPERIHATLLGASAAYVRLGERHSHGRNKPHPEEEPRTPPFAVCKTTRSIPLNHPAVTHVHGTKWMESLQVMCDSAEAKMAMGQKELSRPINHQKDSRGNTLPPLHPGDLYLASESLQALQGCLGGVCDAIDVVFQPNVAARRAFVCIRPPGHHCSAELPSGFCWLNNVHVGIAYAAMNHGLTHAAIIDFDLHHGDGSQTITWDHNRDVHNLQNPKNASAHKKIPIGYYSLHDINSYPCEMGDEDKIRNASTCVHNAHGQSVWNVHLESWKSLPDFWRLYESRYRILIDKAQSFLQHHSELIRQSGGEPKAAIFLSSGFDASQWEMEGMQRHQVNVPTDFYAKFTADVVELSQQPDLGVDGRIVSVLEGGYSDRALTSGVLSHLCGLTHQNEQISNPPVTSSLTHVIPEDTMTEFSSYDSSWWSAEQLEQLESMVAGKMPQPMKSKDGPPSSYSSPTHASTAKMNEVAKERRTISAQLEAKLWLENAPPEPVPEVDWVTATYELSRLLIPEDRQTQSCTHEELNAENSRARRDRQSLVSLPTSDVIEDKMQLRDRKTRATNLMPTQARATTKTASRRTTIAAASELPDPSTREPVKARRRSSAASSVLSGLHDLKLEDDVPPMQGSSRGGSAIPTKLQAPLPVRKPRAPVKKPASRESSPRKAKMAAPNVRLGTVAEPSTSSATDGRRTSQLLSGTGATGGGDGMDDLTNGMKKISIKLKMPTEEQHIAKLKQAEEASKTKPKLPRKPPVPRTTKTKAAPTSSAVRQTPASAPTRNMSKEPEAKTETTDSIRSTKLPTSSSPPVPSFDHSPHSSQNSNVRTMSAVEFLTNTEPEPNPLSTTTRPETYAQDTQAADGNTHQHVADTVNYPSINLRLDSTSPPRDNNVGQQHDRGRP